MESFRYKIFRTLFSLKPSLGSNGILNDAKIFFFEKTKHLLGYDVLFWNEKFVYKFDFFEIYQFESYNSGIEFKSSID